jgi:hypothetical protein
MLDLYLEELDIDIEEHEFTHGKSLLPILYPRVIFC